MTPCFAAERTLGRLTKWLRLLGFDTLYESDLADKKFIDTLENDRILLTRTRRIRIQFASRRMIFVESDHLEQQIEQIF
ncbi:MAG: Mut7-C RNAse domain-containing protein, partial [Desulfobacterales bacterium]